ncbi:hypothetical protein SNEBB_009897 [Seison nebaliae]|nr:hypothetical protein SNEBB_009897 [Seison nebaliae]
MLAITRSFHKQLIKKCFVPLQYGSRMNLMTEMKCEFKPVKKHLLSEDEGPKVEGTCTRDDALKWYTDMVTVRRLESTAISLYKEALVRGFCHIYSGQEAVCVGIKSALNNDSVVTAYRCHGWTYVMGGTPVQVLGELLGKKCGISGGKGGSMHMYTKNFYGGNGIVGAQVPLGAGIALAHKYRNEDNVCISLYGDGAANQGQVFETFNMAKLWNLPVIFICENNGYGMGTSVDRASASTNYYTRGDYIPGILVDGMDVMAVRSATKFAREWCLSGRGPIIMEMSTYRYMGHSMSDPGNSYRTREEVQEVRRTRDPIVSFKEKILSNELATGDELRQIEKKVKEEMLEAEQFVRKESEPAVEELFDNVYKTIPKNFYVRNCRSV